MIIMPFNIYALKLFKRYQRRQFEMINACVEHMLRIFFGLNFPFIYLQLSIVTIELVMFI